jgi:hypothetical protein
MHKPKPEPEPEPLVTVEDGLLTLGQYVNSPTVITRAIASMAAVIAGDLTAEERAVFEAIAARQAENRLAAQAERN